MAGFGLMAATSANKASPFFGGGGGGAPVDGISLDGGGIQAGPGSGSLDRRDPFTGPHHIATAPVVGDCESILEGRLAGQIHGADCWRATKTPQAGNSPAHGRDRWAYGGPTRLRGLAWKPDCWRIR